MAKDLNIPINKRRTNIEVLVLSLVAIGILILGFAPTNLNINPLIIQITGIAICVFTIIRAAQKMKVKNDPSSGLTFSKEGLLDKSSDIGVGLIQWKDIIGLDKEESVGARLIILKVKRHNHYLSQAKNSAVKRLLDQNIRKFETPVVIDTKYLEGSFEEILELTETELKKRKK